MTDSTTTMGPEAIGQRLGRGAALLVALGAALAIGSEMLTGEEVEVCPPPTPEQCAALEAWPEEEEE